MSKLLFADCETTTRNAQTGAIHDFGFILELDGKEVARESIKMRPGNLHEIDEEALSVSGVTWAEIDNYALRQGDGAFKFAQIMFRAGFNNGVHLVGWNNRKFDDDFIREWLGPSFFTYFYSDTIDVLVLASNDLKDERASLENFKLQTIAAHYGIEPKGDWHDALTDVQVTWDIYKKRFEKC